MPTCYKRTTDLSNDVLPLIKIVLGFMRPFPVCTRLVHDADFDIFCGFMNFCDFSGIMNSIIKDNDPISLGKYQLGNRHAARYTRFSLILSRAGFFTSVFRHSFKLNLVRRTVLITYNPIIPPTVHRK